MEPKQRPDVGPKLMDTRAAADYLAVSPRTLWGITSPRGDLHCVRIGSAVRYRLSDLDSWIEQHVG